MSNFREYTLQKLRAEFGLSLVPSLASLDEWLSTQVMITAAEREVLNSLSQKLMNRIYAYNEQELILKCIGTIIGIVDLDGNNYRAFAERQLTATIDGKELSGKPDLMIATGTEEPETPYFCFHEYKKTIDIDRHPAGQCLAAMLAAQHLNNATQVIYGSFVIGREWCFMTLEGNQYAISNAYLVTRDDIFDIARILRALRLKIDAIVNAPIS
ncbi:MAG: hypothetical protein JNM36_12895 [Chitinophagales bacterium]|nr:hypothetical protein [Chitinophagales bacterium]HNL07041.1 hypothetical protein [Chitinophagales bacterium]